MNKAALNGKLSAYYLDTTWETRLPAFRTAPRSRTFTSGCRTAARCWMGTRSCGPMCWSLTAPPPPADKPLAVFGALSFWWMGEHGSPRIDTSEHVWFANDQLAVRFIEEIDFDYAASDATAILLTAGA